MQDTQAYKNIHHIQHMSHAHSHAQIYEVFMSESGCSNRTSVLLSAEIMALCTDDQIQYLSTKVLSSFVKALLSITESVFGFPWKIEYICKTYMILLIDNLYITSFEVTPCG